MGRSVAVPFDRVVDAPKFSFLRNLPDENILQEERFSRYVPNVHQPTYLKRKLGN